MNTSLFRKLLLPVFLFATLSGYGQSDSLYPGLSLSSALETALKNNLGLNIARNNVARAENQNSIGNAGFLPSVDVRGGINTSSNNISQEYSNGNTVKRDNSKTDYITGSAELSWVLFDGMRMFASKKVFSATEEYERIRLKAEIENVVEEVMSSYYNVVRLQQIIKITEQNIAFYDERLKIADARYKIGSSSKLEFLQANVDRNEQRAKLIGYKAELDASFSSLNQVMGNTEFTPVNATDSIVTDYRPDLNGLLKSALTGNIELQSQVKNTELIAGTINEYRASRYPWLSLDAGYTYNRTENQAGFSLYNETQGPYAGLSLSWNLFNGLKTNTAVRNAQLELSSSEFAAQEIRNRINHEITSIYREYSSALELLNLEEENTGYAYENVTVALEAYKLGSISMLALREAQYSYETASARLIEARYRAKLSEIRLRKLNGDLVN